MECSKCVRKKDKDNSNEINDKNSSGDELSKLDLTQARTLRRERKSTTRIDIGDFVHVEKKHRRKRNQAGGEEVVVTAKKPRKKRSPNVKKEKKEKEKEHIEPSNDITHPNTDENDSTHVAAESQYYSENEAIYIHDDESESPKSKKFNSTKNAEGSSILFEKFNLKAKSFSSQDSSLNASPSNDVANKKRKFNRLSSDANASMNEISSSSSVTSSPKKNTVPVKRSRSSSATIQKQD